MTTERRRGRNRNAPQPQREQPQKIKVELVGADEDDPETLAKVVELLSSWLDT